jgi:hypothetical protein
MSLRGDPDAGRLDAASDPFTEAEQEPTEYEEERPGLPEEREQQ